MRGWNPLNYILLNSPEIESNKIPTPSPHPPKVNTISSDEGTTLSLLTTGKIDINFRDGLAGHCVLSHFYRRQPRIKRSWRFKKRNSSNKTLFDHMEESKRLTAGVIFNAGVVDLVNGGLLDIVKENQKTKNKEVLEKIDKELQRFNKRIIKAMFGKIQKEIHLFKRTQSNT